MTRSQTDFLSLLTVRHLYLLVTSNRKVVCRTTSLVDPYYTLNYSIINSKDRRDTFTTQSNVTEKVTII